MDSDLAEPPAGSARAEVTGAVHDAATIAQTELQAGAMGTTGVLMQAITHIGPAIGLATSIAFVTSLVGISSPVAYFLAFLLVLSICAGLTRLAKKFPSAGGYFTYTSRTLHPRVGLLTAWLYFLYDPLAAAIVISYFGFILESYLKARYNFDFPWWATLLILSSMVTAALYRGIKLSVTALTILGGLEIAILLALAVSGLISPGPGGFSFSPFNPANAPGHGLYLAVVFSIVTFTGFESVAPLAEESKNPTKIIPRAIIISVVLMGLFFLFTSWGTVIGWGTDHPTALASSVSSPLLVISQRLWGFGWVFVLLAIGNSALATGLAASNASTRVFFAMGRTGVLPSWLSETHPEFKTPKNAILFQSIVTLTVGLGVGFWIGADQEFYVIGLMLTLGLIFVYGAGNLGAMRYYRTEAKAQFNLWLDAVLPLVSTVALIWVGYKSVVPLPAAPVRYAPFIVAGWLIAGLVLIWALARSGRETWMVKASETAYERPIEPER